MNHQKSTKQKTKNNNIFLCRMKKIMRKKQRERYMVEQERYQDGVVGVEIGDRRTSQVERFFTHQSHEKGYYESISKPLNLSLNLRQTLTPKTIMNSPKKSKHPQEISSYMSQLSQIDKNKTNLSLIFSSTSHRPQWRSLQLRSGKKGYEKYAKKFGLFRQNQQEDQQIQLYNTNNIFIVKKKIIERSQESLDLPGPDIKSATIKYKKNQNFRLCTQLSPKQSITGRSQKKANSKKVNKNQESGLSIENYAKQRQKQIYNTEQSKIIQGLYSLQPWNNLTDDQKHHLIRGSPQIFH